MLMLSAAVVFLLPRGTAAYLAGRSKVQKLVFRFEFLVSKTICQRNQFHFSSNSLIWIYHIFDEQKYLFRVLLRLSCTRLRFRIDLSPLLLIWFSIWPAGPSWEQKPNFWKESGIDELGKNAEETDFQRFYRQINEGKKPEKIFLQFYVKIFQFEKSSKHSSVRRCCPSISRFFTIFISR